jgi:hypothetical protein
VKIGRYAYGCVNAHENSTVSVDSYVKGCVDVSEDATVIVDSYIHCDAHRYSKSAMVGCDDIRDYQCEHNESTNDSRNNIEYTEIESKGLVESMNDNMDLNTVGGLLMEIILSGIVSLFMLDFTILMFGTPLEVLSLFTGLIFLMTFVMFFLRGVFLMILHFIIAVLR